MTIFKKSKEMQETISKLTAEVDTLKKELVVAKESKELITAEELAKLTSENEGFQKQISELKNQLEESSAKIVQAEQSASDKALEMVASSGCPVIAVDAKEEQSGGSLTKDSFYTTLASLKGAEQRKYWDANISKLKT